LFSQRNGFTSIKSHVQVEHIDSTLKNSLWNILTDFFWRDLLANTVKAQNPKLSTLLHHLWRDFFKIPTDTLSFNLLQGVNALRSYFFDEETPWYRIYDIVEFVSVVCGDNVVLFGLGTKERFINTCNQILEREVSGYRFIDGIIAPITAPIEIEEIEDSLHLLNKYRGVSTHLKQALVLLSDKQIPDYRNSIKESISAVESICKVIVENDSGGLKDAIKALEKRGITLHPSLRNAFINLYGYTSDENGIRHAIFDEVPNISFEDAKYMLVTCSSFCNYIIGKTSK
jgi:hypothetical protein